MATRSQTKASKKLNGALQNGDPTTMVAAALSMQQKTDSGQSVTFSEWNGNRMLNVQNPGFDRFPTSLGARKVRDVIQNIEASLKFLAEGSDVDKQVAVKFWSKFQRKSK
jgi:hypothetical protein